MKNLLKEGDVIFLKRGMKVHAWIPEKFVRENSKLSKELTRSVVEVGKYFAKKPDVTRDIEMLANDIVKSFESKLGLKIKAADATVFITSKLPAIKTDSYILDEGEFVVISTAMEGGSTGHDAYPDGHHVFCKRLNADGSYNDNGTEINFYQSGCFTGTILPDDIEVLRIQPKKLVNITVKKFA
jgi:hypothetical protein